jgi:hypothetical protein
MAFRKRNTALSRAPADGDASPSSPVLAEGPPAPTPTGVRPSPIDGRPTTSTGTPSLDGILAGHAGLPLGNSILIEESGTTDYAGALLRFYAAEGVVQGHKVHVVGMGEVWGRELPGISEGKSDEKRREVKERSEKMKIAWRYEGLGQFETARGASCVFSSMQCYTFVRLTLRDRATESADTRRECRGGHLLPHFRPRQTTHATCGNRNELHRHTPNGTVHVSTHGNTAERATTACLDTSAYNPPPRHPVSALASIVSSHILTSQLDTAVPARSSCTTATEPYKAHRYRHTPAIIIPSHLGPRTLGGDPL